MSAPGICGPGCCNTTATSARVTSYRCQGCGTVFPTMQDHYCNTTPSSTEVNGGT